MNSNVRAASRMLSLAICLVGLVGLLGAGCVQNTVRSVKDDLIESDSEGRNTVLDIKIEKYEKLAKEFPKEPLYRERLARLHWMRKDHRRALDQLAVARRLDKDNPKYAYIEGTIYSAIGNYRLAEASFEEVLDQTDGEFTGPYLQLAELCLVQDREEEALEYLAQCVEVDPTFSTPHYYLGRIHLEHKDEPKAVEHFEQYLRLGGGVFQEEVLQMLAGLEPQYRLHHIR